MDTDTLARAFAGTRRILADVTPDQYGLPTPCRSWDVRALVNHICEGANWFPLCVDNGVAPDSDPTHGADYAAGDVLEAYDRGVRESLRAFGAPGALERILKLPFGEIPGAAFLGIATNDVFVHGWDLATATGQEAGFDHDLAAELLELARAFVVPAIRGEDGVMPFGPEEAPPEGATPADRLAAFLGRRVGH